MNKELIKELELLRFYKEKGCLDTHYKVLIDYIDELEQQNKELHNKIDKAIEYLEEDDNFWIPDSYSEDKVKMIQEELLKILKGDVDE